MRWMVLAMVIAACGVTPYNQATTAKPLDRERWLVRVEGQGLGPGELLEYTNLRAGEICPLGYVIEQTSGGNTIPVTVTNTFTGQSVTGYMHGPSAAVVRCTPRGKDAPVPLVPPVPADEP